MKKWIVEIIDIVLLFVVIVLIFKQKQKAASQCAFLVFTWFAIGITIGIQLVIKSKGVKH